MRAWHVALILLLAVAAFQSGTRLFQDDFGYLMWGILNRRDWTAWLRGPDFFTYHRPLNALAWWVSGRTGFDGELVRWLQVGLWAACGGLLARAANHRRAIVGVVVLMLTNQVWVDTLTWRSWISTTGAVCGLVAAMLMVSRGAAAGWVLAAGLATLGFKEVAAVAIACRSLSEPRYRGVGVALFLLAAMSSASSSFKLGLANVMPNLHYHAETLGLFVAVVPALLAGVRSRFDGVAALLLLPVALLPAPIAGGCVLVAACVAVRKAPRWWVPLGATLVGPLLGLYQSRQYLLEFWAILLVFAVAERRIPVSAWTWGVIVVLGLRSAVDFERHRATLRAEWSEQRAFIDSFHPPAARHLYHPDPNWSWDLDALYWVSGGATLDGQPPAGARPAQIGPRSGVWADLTTDQ